MHDSHDYHEAGAAGAQLDPSVAEFAAGFTKHYGRFRVPAGRREDPLE